MVKKCIQLPQLPNEIILLIINQLRVKDILALTQSCHKFRDLTLPIIWRNTEIVLDSYAPPPLDEYDYDDKNKHTRTNTAMRLDGPALIELKRFVFRQQTDDVLRYISHLHFASQFSTHGVVDWLVHHMSKRLTKLRSIVLEFQTQTLDYPLFRNWINNLPGDPQISIDVRICENFGKSEFSFMGGANSSNVKKIRVQCAAANGVELKLPQCVQDLDLFYPDYDVTQLAGLRNLRRLNVVVDRISSLDWIPNSVESLCLDATQFMHTIIRPVLLPNVRHFRITTCESILDYIDMPNLRTISLGSVSSEQQLVRTSKILAKFKHLYQLVLLGKSAVSAEVIMRRTGQVRSLIMMSAIAITGSPKVDELIKLMRRCESIEFMLLDSDMLAKCGFVEAFVVILSRCHSLQRLCLDCVPTRWADKYGEYFTQMEATEVVNGYNAEDTKLRFLEPPVLFDRDLFIANYF